MDYPIRAVQETAREYLRVSYAQGGRLESPDEQHEVNALHARSNGWKLGTPYAEPEAVSASRHGGRQRGEFTTLLADLDHGRFAASILILWEPSRGSRQVSEWVQLVDACERARVRIYVTSHSRAYDPANSRDRRTLLEDAVDSEYEAAKISQRVTRSAAARAARGEPHGRVPYGYRRVYDPLTRRLVAQEPDPAEAAVVAELLTRLYGGESVRSIERDFAARGITTRGTAKWPPRPFCAQQLRAMALNPAYAGLRTHLPKASVEGWRRRGALDGQVTATWPPLVDAEVFWTVRAMLTDPARVSTRPGAARHLLSMIATCGVCSSPLGIRYRNNRREYTCRQAQHVRHSADDLDREATAAILAWLSRPDVAVMLRPSPEGLPELAHVRAELAKAERDLAEWRARAGRREVTAESFAVIEPAILADITRLQERDRELSVPRELAGWTGTWDEVRARWQAAPVEAQRRVARMVMSPGLLGVLRLDPGQRGVALPASERVRWERA